MIDNLEKERLQFVEERDGIEGMLKFAEQTLCIYLQASIDPKSTKYGSSIKELKATLESHGKIVKFLVIESKE